MKKVLLIFFIFIFSSLKSFADGINVAYNIDDNYTVFTMISMDSILKHNKSKSDYTFYILHTEKGLSSWNKFQLSAFVFLKGQKIKFITVDDEKLNGIKYGKTCFVEHINPIAFARVYLVDLLPPDVNKVLYLDADTLIKLDLKSLYDIDLDGKIVGMVLDQASRLPHFKKISLNYCNSGVILFNTQLWKKRNITNKILVENKKFSYEFIEQDLFNYILKNDIKCLDSRFNHQICDYCVRTHEQSYYDKYISDSILHFITAQKPWVFNNIVSKEDIAYYKYWLKSPLVIYLPYYFSKSEMFIPENDFNFPKYVLTILKKIKRINMIYKIYF